MQRTKLFTTVALSLLAASTALAQDASPALPRGRMSDRTFSADAISRMRDFYQANSKATVGKKNCLQTMNKGLRLLYDKPRMKLGSTVDLSMAALRNMNPRRAAGFRTRNFLTVKADGSTRRTTGITQPDKLRRSVWDYVIASAADAKGYSVFGMSPMDGYHSVFLVLDTNDPSDPKVYWMDQWESKGGWKLYASKQELDGEVENLTHNWWLSKFREAGKRFKTRCRLYQLIPDNTNEPAHNVATVIMLPRKGKTDLPLREGPSMKTPVATDSDGEKVYAGLGDQLLVVGRGGSQNHFLELQLLDGRTAWAPAFFFHMDEAPEETVNGLITALEEASAAPKAYAVKSGDSLWKIAKRHEVSVSKLMAVNGLSTSMIHPGQRLTIPVTQ